MKMKVIKDEKTAEIVGLCFGDGSLTRRKSGKNKDKLRFQMRGHIIEDRYHYDNYIKPLFDKVIGKVSIVEYNGKKQYDEIDYQFQMILSEHDKKLKDY